jgi:hypothetical protein
MITTAEHTTPVERDQRIIDNITKLIALYRTASTECPREGLRAWSASRIAPLEAALARHKGTAA